MSIARLAKTKASRVLGIDASTTSVAFCLYYNRRPVRWGKILLNGATIYDRILDAKVKIMALQQTLQADYVAIEAAVFVKSPSVAIKMAMVFGAILAELQYQGVKVIDVVPIQWQTHIGNPVLTKEEKAALKREFPGKSASWYQTKGREKRKQRTMNIFNKKFNMNITDNDVGDAVGVAYFAYYQLTRRT